MKLINLHSIISISRITSLSSSISKVIASRAFIKYKNHVLGTLGLTIDSHINTDSIVII